MSVSQLDLVAGFMEVLDEQLQGQPVNERVMNAIIEAANIVVAELDKPHVDAKPGMGLQAWAVSDDTGLSSRRLAIELAKHAAMKLYIREPDLLEPNPHPHDPADFGRCVRMLDAAPQLREHLPKCRTISPTWAALIDRWDEMEALYREEFPTGRAPKLYDLMRGIIDSAREPSPCT